MMLPSFRNAQRVGWCWWEAEFDADWLPTCLTGGDPIHVTTLAWGRTWTTTLYGNEGRLVTEDDVADALYELEVRP